MAWSKRRGGRRGFHRKPKPIYGWLRRLPINLSGTLTGGTGESIQQLASGDLVAGNQDQGGSLMEWGGIKSPIIRRIIIRVALVISSNLVPALIEYFIGVRIAERRNADASDASDSSLFLGDNISLHEDWLRRDVRVYNVPVVAGAPFLLQDGAENGFRMDFKPNRRLGLEQELLFQHGWRFAGAGGFPDAAIVGTLNVDILFEKPRGT